MAEVSLEPTRSQLPLAEDDTQTITAGLGVTRSEPRHQQCGFHTWGREGHSKAICGRHHPAEACHGSPLPQDKGRGLATRFKGLGLAHLAALMHADRPAPTPATSHCGPCSVLDTKSPAGEGLLYIAQVRRRGSHGWATHLET